MIEIKNICKTYNEGKESEVRVLKNINLTINDGEMVMVLGRSGSGKTTLFNIISGLLSPDDGQVIIDGEDISNYNEKERTILRRKKIGFVFQSYNLIPVLTAKENIELPMLSEDEEYLELLLSKLELKDRANYFPSELSGGQKQRVAICRAIINRPSILLADEPTGNLDSETELEVIKLFKKLSEELKTTVIIVTHNRELTKYADRVIKINDGGIINDCKIV